MGDGQSRAGVPAVSRDELRAMRATGAPFKLVMAASDFGFRAKHIPGSLHFSTHGGPDARGDRTAGLAKDDDIVVYCSNIDCNASLAAIAHLRELGYHNVRHYAGGLIDWEAAGLPVEGDWGSDPASAR
jgi:rhodanese-related sulfurtransferase